MSTTRGGRDLPVYVSIEEAAEFMSLSTRTTRRCISDGTIPAYHRRHRGHRGHRAIRIPLAEIQAALRPIPSA